MTKAKSTIATERAPLKFAMMSCYANLMIEDAAKAAAMVDDAAEAFDVASFNADPIDQDRLRVAHRC
ncbi:MAG: hypothetical protein RIC87_15485, partial [Kiloniellales bacterium]